MLQWIIASLLFLSGYSSSVISPQDTRTTTNEASRDDSDILLIIIMCIIFCFAVRHANDFYSGETVTLVEEGIWGGRFRHRGEYKYLSHIERDFSDMFEQLKDKEDQRVRQQMSINTEKVSDAVIDD